MFGAQPENRDDVPRAATPAAGGMSAAEEQRLRWKIRVAAASARRAHASRQYGRTFDETFARVRDQLDESFWSRDEWGSSFDRRDFARTVVELVEERPFMRNLDSRLINAVLESLEFTLTTPIAHRPGCSNWNVTRCATYHEDVVAADAVAAIFDARALMGHQPA